ncbi:MAG: terminase gpP N-terminus-related DNA-binding protein [Limisphaerales bacterium]
MTDNLTPESQPSAKPRRPGPPIDPAIREEAHRLYLAGKMPTAIADALGLKLDTVRQWSVRGRWRSERYDLRQERRNQAVVAVAPGNTPGHAPLVSCDGEIGGAEHEGGRDVSERTRRNLRDTATRILARIDCLDTRSAATALAQLTKALQLIEGWGAEAPRQAIMINVDRRRDLDAPPGTEVIEVNVDMPPPRAAV